MRTGDNPKTVAKWESADLRFRSADRTKEDLRGITSYDFVCEAWTSDPSRFKISPLRECLD